MRYTIFDSQLLALFNDINSFVMKECKVVMPHWEMKKKEFSCNFLSKISLPKMYFNI